MSGDVAAQRHVQAGTIDKLDQLAVPEQPGVLNQGWRRHDRLPAAGQLDQGIVMGVKAIADALARELDLHTVLLIVELDTANCGNAKITRRVPAPGVRYLLWFERAGLLLLLCHYMPDET